MTGPSADQPAIEPESIDVDREVGVRLTWADGHVAHLRLLELRQNCPCAECRQRRRAGQVVWPQSGSPIPLRLLNARLVGGYGIGIDWNDGHNTGIFTWEALRRWPEGWAIPG